MTQQTTETLTHENITEEMSGSSFKAAWAKFVETEAANFFTGYKLEKMTCEDGNGNKAKLTKTKDCGIRIEYTSTINI